MLRVALGALAVLMVPLVASQFVEDWHWGVGGFVRVYVLFFATGMVYALIARKMGAWSYKAGVGVALVAGFALGWSTMVQIGGLGTSGAPVVSQRARGGSHWGLSGAAEGARIGSSRCSRWRRRLALICRDAAFGRAARHGAENGHRAWCLRGVVHRVRSAVPAREFGGIEVRPRPITIGRRFDVRQVWPGASK